MMRRWAMTGHPLNGMVRAPNRAATAARMLAALLK